VQGKLVPQDENDEPATSLLERIRVEKEQLIKDGKLKKEKSMPPITEDEIPFDVPESWEWVRLGDISKIGTGATPLTSNTSYYDGDIPWVTSSETGNEFITEASAYITKKALAETNCTIYPIGTLIVAMYGQGKTRGQVSELKIEAATNQACAGISPIVPNCYVVGFLKIFFLYIYEIIRKQAKGTGQPNLNLSIISNMAIPIPPLVEQYRIVAKCENLFSIMKQGGML
jgi:type I restriction enzyme S subunit